MQNSNLTYTLRKKNGSKFKFNPKLKLDYWIQNERIFKSKNLLQIFNSS